MHGFRLLKKSFFDRDNPLDVARELIGKALVSTKEQRLTAGIITECEAYWAPDDKASHARDFKRTPRNEVMFGQAGTAYVYICYGIHRLFNIVTAKPGVPHAVLIRSIQPICGVATMLQRRNRQSIDTTLCTGPGNVTLCLGIDMEDNGLNVLIPDSPIQVCAGMDVPASRVVATPRIGVDGAGDSAALMYRFVLAGNPFLSSTAFTNKYLQDFTL